ncbi:MAG: isocitrate lyase/phosphoenolpyruvate mutase family protein [Pseudomonadota bacterium]
MNQLLTTFRQLHQPPQLLRLANAWDAGSARLIESLGATAVATTSAGLAWSLGYADGHNMPAEAAIATAQNIVRVLSVPLTVDMENGYSDDPKTVAANIMRLVDSGVAGINIEDGGDAPELLARKVEAIKNAAAKAGSDIFINTRTDVYLRGLAPETARVQEALARAALYRAAGADGLFVPGVCKPDEIAAIARSAGLPLNVMDWPGVPSAAQLTELGVRRLSAGSGIAQALWGAAREMAQGFLETGNAGPLAAKALSYGEIQQLFLA